MESELARICRGTDLKVDGDVVTVGLVFNRLHRVLVRDAGEAYELAAVVARRKSLEGITDVPKLAWRRNRSAQLVGFRVDRRGRLIGESWVPKAGLTSSEFKLYVRRIASECDRLEYLLTGRDAE